MSCLRANIYITSYIHICIPTCLPMPIYLHNYLPTQTYTCLPAFLHTYIHTKHTHPTPPHPTTHHTTPPTTPHHTTPHTTPHHPPHHTTPNIHNIYNQCQSLYQHIFSHIYLWYNILISTIYQNYFLSRLSNDLPEKMSITSYSDLLEINISFNV